MKVRRVRRVCPSRINSRTTRDLCFKTLHRNNCQRNLLSFYYFFHLSVPLAEKQVTSAQIKEHRVVVLDLSDTYLKSKFILLF